MLAKMQSGEDFAVQTKGGGRIIVPNVVAEPQFNPTSAYAVDAKVWYGSVQYVCTTATTAPAEGQSNPTPEEDTAHWTELPVEEMAKRSEIPSIPVAPVHELFLNARADVWLSAGDGDDANDGLSPTNAVRTIAGAYAAAKAAVDAQTLDGSRQVVVAVDEGVYGSVKIYCELTAGIAFRAVGARKSTLVVPSNDPGDNGNQTPMSCDNGKYPHVFEMEGFTFTGFNGRHSTDISWDSHQRGIVYGMTLRRCLITGNRPVCTKAFVCGTFIDCEITGNATRPTLGGEGGYAPFGGYGAAYDDLAYMTRMFNCHVWDNDFSTFQYFSVKVEAANCLFENQFAVIRGQRISDSYGSRNNTMIAERYTNPNFSDSSYGDTWKQFHKLGSNYFAVIASSAGSTTDPFYVETDDYVCVQTANLTDDKVAADASCPSVRSDGSPDFGYRDSGLGLKKTAAKIDAALAGKATKADATLNERGYTAWELSEYTAPEAGGPIVIRASGSAWYPCCLSVCGMSKSIDSSTTSVTWAAGEWTGGYPMTAERANASSAWVIVTPQALQDGYEIYSSDGLSPFMPVHPESYGSAKGNAQSTSLTWAGAGPNKDWLGTTDLVATRTALQGYKLGSQTDKPLASEAEAEALRTGKQDALSAQQLANIAAVPNKANNADVVHKSGDTMTGPLHMGDNYLKWRDGNLIYWLSTNGLYIWDDGDDETHSPSHIIEFPLVSGTLALTAANPTAGNLAALTATGDLKDSGYKATDFVEKGATNILIGSGASKANNATNAVVIGVNASANGSATSSAVAIGTGAKAKKTGAIQLGVGENSEEKSLRFRDTTVVDGNGKIPTGNLDANVVKTPVYDGQNHEFLDAEHLVDGENFASTGMHRWTMPRKGIVYIHLINNSTSGSTIRIGVNVAAGAEAVDDAHCITALSQFKGNANQVVPLYLNANDEVCLSILTNKIDYVLFSVFYTD